jgi:hypothetical protein
MTSKTRGAPREGELLLHGIVWCGRCGHKMYVRYKRGGQYVCNHRRTHHDLPSCQYVRSPRVDEAVAQAFLTALAPAEIDALSRAHRAKQQTDKALLSGAERQLERKRYEAALAERQYRRVDPDNRLVAAELERRWEAALCDVRAAEEALTRQKLSQADEGLQLGKAAQGKVIALAGRLPGIWSGASDQERKSLLRCLVEKVILDRSERDVVKVRIVWRGGAVTELEIRMRVNAVCALARGEEMRERVLELARADLPDDEIAAALTAEGHRSPRSDSVLPTTVRGIRLSAGRKMIKQRTRWRHDAAQLSAPELASRLNIPVNWIYVKIRRGHILIDRQPSGAFLFENTAAVSEAVQKLRGHVLKKIDLRINQPHQEGH